MNKSDRIEAIIALGEHFTQRPAKLVEAMNLAFLLNPWFTEKNVDVCLKNWSNALIRTEVEKWLSQVEDGDKKRVGIVMAGNIPLVGLHDLLAVFGHGKIAVIKKSHNDDTLIQYVIDFFHECNTDFRELITTADQMKGIDAVIATGSNNSSRYFEYYFKSIPHIIRKNRTGIAVLNGNESVDDMAFLAKDIFTYFGLGCRNVTKLYVPQGYDFVPLIESMGEFEDVINHHKYANNYTYHKAIFLMNLDKHLDTGFLLIKEDSGLHAPLGCLFYESYNNLEDLRYKLDQAQDQLQVIESNNEEYSDVRLGQAQQTTLFDYADDVDTLDFLNSI